MTPTAAALSLGEIRREALTLVRGVAHGQPLDDATAALIGLAVRACVTSLDMEGSRIYTERALDAGATADQVHDVLVLISGLGVHTLEQGCRHIAEVLRARAEPAARTPLDDEPARHWERYVARHPYCAVPWRSKALPAVTKELICVAVDATPTHRYLPGMRMHLANALELGAGRAAVVQALDIAAGAPSHRGVR